MQNRWTRIVARLVFTLVGFFVMSLATGARVGQDEPQAPSLRLRSSPRVAFAPVEVLFVAELRGGDDDYEDFYCPSLEWDWGDDTRSESTGDCDPYEPGVSEIRRRYSMRHEYRYGGRYEARIHLKQGDDTVATARTTIEVRGGFLR